MRKETLQEICLSNRELLKLVYKAFDIYAEFEYPMVSASFLNIQRTPIYNSWKRPYYITSYSSLTNIERVKFNNWLKPTEDVKIIEEEEDGWLVGTVQKQKTIWKIKTNFIPIILKALCERFCLKEGHYIIYNG